MPFEWLSKCLLFCNLIKYFLNIIKQHINSSDFMRMNKVKQINMLKFLKKNSQSRTKPKIKCQLYLRQIISGCFEMNLIFWETCRLKCQDLLSLLLSPQKQSQIIILLSQHKEELLLVLLIYFLMIGCCKLICRYPFNHN